MASLLQAEKQLFDKFWRGTFKAVATPRPESVIIASIAARREANRLETSVCVTAKPGETKSLREEPEVKETEKKRHRKHRGRKRHSRRRCPSVSLDADFSPRPAAKTRKKKKKSVRKRRRERSHSSSPSPLRKKKKKKKNSSKKRKQHRATSKKRRHSSSSTRRKRKEDRKHKKRCHSASHHRRRSRRANSSDWRSSSTESRCGDSGKSGFQRSSHGSGARGGFEWCSAVKLATKIPSKCTVVHSRPGLETSVVQDSPCILGKGRADYDSGHDTSSPLSSKTGVSRAQVTADRREKLKFMDNSSDSGNSLSSYSESLSKAELRERRINTSVFSKLRSEESSSCVGSVSHRSPSSVKYQYRPETRSRSRSRSSRSSHHWGRYISRSRSPSSSRRSYSRSSSYSCDSRRGSVCSVSSRRSGKHSRYTPDRIRERIRRSSSSCEKPSKRSRKRSRRRICSPMRKRRRDSPSHLEARRITSARKRPIPYYRPSPSSSSSRSSSLSSWSLFSLQSRSPIRSRSRSHSRSSYRSHSRSSPLSSIYSSRSYDTLASYSRARR
ncbi:serine/arginine repetitive matrix protein 4 [Ictalurus furcatus]|uniref:serine/arginine repetitive matrix protein 4 n=1 Tax=Ictalurus furcatus TaxID=66913 RepID=UPI00234FF366|nr:serine/arginine repetitive matrix protein 4 [Ictalurus furcatus]